MRTIQFFAVTCFISSFSALANMSSHAHPHLFMLIEFGSWVPFILYYRSRQRRIDARRRRAYLHEACMRTYLRKNGYRH